MLSRSHIRQREPAPVLRREDHFSVLATVVVSISNDYHLLPYLQTPWQTPFARRAQNLEEHKKTLEKDVPGVEVLIIAGDISDPEVGKRVVSAAVGAWKRLDIVIANSGIASGGIESTLS